MNAQAVMAEMQRVGWGGFEAVSGFIGQAYIIIRRINGDDPDRVALGELFRKDPAYIEAQKILQATAWLDMPSKRKRKSASKITTAERQRDIATGIVDWMEAKCADEIAPIASIIGKAVFAALEKNDTRFFRDMATMVERTHSAQVVPGDRVRVVVLDEGLKADRGGKLGSRHENIMSRVQAEKIPAPAKETKPRPSRAIEGKKREYASDTTVKKVSREYEAKGLLRRDTRPGPQRS